MKILIFTDMHGSKKAFNKIKKKSKDADIIICAGDVSIFEQNIEYILYNLNKLNKPILMVHGNHESKEFLKELCSVFPNIIFIHEKAHRIKDHVFLGYGGGGFALTDPAFKKIGKKFDSKIKESDKKILILHGPPYGLKVDKIMDEHCGNKTYTEYIHKSQPHLVVCGHLHETAGFEDKIKKSRIINPGPYGKIINL